MGAGFHRLAGNKVAEVDPGGEVFLMLCQRSLIRVPGFCHNKGLRIASPFCDVRCITTVVVKLAVKVESPCLGYLKASLHFHWIIQGCLQLDTVTTRTPNIHLL